MKDRVHGPEGLSQAVTCPEEWQYFDVNSGTKGEWKTFLYFTDHSLPWFMDCDWRRKPIEKREPMRFESEFCLAAADNAACEMGALGDPPLSVHVHLKDVWRGKRIRLAIEELLDPHPARQPVEPPCTIISWQRKQVELLNTIDRDAVVISELKTQRDSALSSQVEMAAEIERLKKEQESLLVIYRRTKEESVAMYSENNRQRDEIRSALASQKAAAAALETERMHGCWLRNALEMCAKYFGSASVDDLRQHIAKTLRDIDETAGKESG